ncbi:transmembrane protein, putative [Medicago truncatula]|uniref:Transmembrane protein, putative n=1 Tax=Medicago truncatula TaxID=3880 RepID=G7JUR9_MEDTR|nr:transmembrane protein, putative [Medicago truncatula]
MDSSIIETANDQGKADENCDDDSYSVDTFFRDEHQEKVITYSLHLGSSLITLLVLVFWPTHETGPALLKQNKTVLQLSFLLHFSSYILFSNSRNVKKWQF